MGMQLNSTKGEKICHHFFECFIYEGYTYNLTSFKHLYTLKTSYLNYLMWFYKNPLTIILVLFIMVIWCPGKCFHEIMLLPRTSLHPIHCHGFSFHPSKSHVYLQLMIMALNPNWLAEHWNALCKSFCQKYLWFSIGYRERWSFAYWFQKD